MEQMRKGRSAARNLEQDGFDPAKVPPFPVLGLELTTEGAVLLEGAPVDVDGDGPAVVAGVGAVVAWLVLHGVSAVRVRCTAPGEDGPHVELMVVDAQGGTHELGDATAARRGPSRRVLLGASVVLAAVAVGVPAGLVLAAHGGDAGVDAPVEQVVSPVGAGANLPVPPPPGFSTVATWSVPVADGLQSFVLDADTIVVPAADGTWTARRAEDGAVEWIAKGAYEQAAPSRVQGRPVLAATSGGDLQAWALDLPGQSEIDPVDVPLPAQSSVKVDPMGVLVDLGDQTVMVDGPDGFVRRDVPVGATPVAATSRGVIAVSASGVVVVPAEGDPRTVSFAPPAGAVGPAVSWTGIDDDHVLGVWDTADPGRAVAALVRVSDGTSRATAVVPSDALGNEPRAIHDPVAGAVVVGDLYVSPGRDAIADLGAGATSELGGTAGALEPTAVLGSAVFGMTTAVAVRVDVPTVGDESPAWVAFSSDPDLEQASPDAVIQGAAFVAADKVDERVLYALARTEEQR
ncbi:hypothetical protein [Isoptericola sp. NPDC056134]|uniref:hypothetical protein n=1 Tax=Isoptericola sp. NPDC056134 TaxID=3345723 RepID=UPI0035EEC627